MGACTPMPGFGTEYCHRGFRGPRPGSRAFDAGKTAQSQNPLNTAMRRPGGGEVPFELVQKPAFYHDLVSLPRDVQKSVVTAVRHIAQDPFRANGHAKPVLKERYKNLYRYKLKKDYRIVYSVGDGCVCLLGIRLRSDVYEKFYLDPTFTPPTGLDADSAEPQLIPTTVYDTFNSPLIGQGAGPSPPGKDDKDEPTDNWAVPVTEETAAAGAPGETTPAWLLEQLLEYWGVAGPHRAAILRCQSLEDLLDLDIPDDIKERVLHLQKPPSLGAILEQPTMELRDPADLDRYVAGELKRFLLKLDPEQERAAARALRGPVLVKGGPGTGKSLVALYRIKNLLENPDQHQLFATPRPRILVLTYTRSLINVCQELLEELLGRLPDDLHVMNLDRKVHEIITSAGFDFRPASKEQKQRALARALEEFSPSGGPLQRSAMRRALKSLRPDYLLAEFDWVIEGRGLPNLEAYLAEDRSGRGIRLDRSARQAVWELHGRYLEQLRGEGLATWDLYRLQAEELVRRAPENQRYDTVIIDEAQDLTPAALRVCVALARKPDGLYLTADASQSIYTRGFAWSRVHSDLQVRGRALVLKRNYRTTKQIAMAAAQLLRDHGGGDEEVLEVDAVRQGPRPVLVACSDHRHEVRVIGRFLRQAAEDTRLPVGSGAVLVRTNKDASELARALSNLGIPAQHVRGDDVTLETRHVRVMTIHTAKGLEFPFVAVARVNAGVFPVIPANMSPEELDEQIAGERRLLFVALSRAMRRLLVTYNQAQPSRFIGELNPALWTRGLG